MTSDDLGDPAEPIESVLQRKVPGLLVTRTGDGGVALQIRSTSAFGSEKPPLYVLDDAPFQPGPDGALTGVSVQDIQSIRVLRGAEAALYGIEGANGVIVIRTKRAAAVKPRGG